MDKQKKYLIESFEKSIFNNIIDFSDDILEIPLDSIIENNTLKELPIVGSMIGIGKTMIAVRDLHLLKKTISFISKINDGSISKEKIEKHRILLEKNKKKKNRELEYLIIMLDRYNEAKKSNILGNLYLKYIDDEIEFEWDDFCIFAEIIEKFSIYDYDSLIDIYKKKYIKYNDKYNPLSLTRLHSLGLVDFISGIKFCVDSEECVAQINPLGRCFVEVTFMDKINNIIPFEFGE